MYSWCREKLQMIETYCLVWIISVEDSTCPSARILSDATGICDAICDDVVRLFPKTTIFGCAALCGVSHWTLSIHHLLLASTVGTEVNLPHLFILKFSEGNRILILHRFLWCSPYGVSALSPKCWTIREVDDECCKWSTSSGWYPFGSFKEYHVIYQ